MVRIVFVGSILINAAIQLTGLFLEGIWMFLCFSILPALLTYLQKGFYKSAKLRSLSDFYFWMLLMAGPFATPGALFLLMVPLKPHFFEGFQSVTHAKVEFHPVEKMKYNLTRNFWTRNAENTIQPFIDIMKSDNLIKKRSTINKVVQHPGPYTKGVLDLGLKDENKEINFYAASGLILINDRFVENIRELEDLLEKEGYRKKHYLELADIYKKMLHWGFADSNDLPTYRKKIIDLYTKVLEKDPENETAMKGLTQVLIQEDKETEAYYRLKELPESMLHLPGLIGSFMQILLQKRHLAELIYYCRDLQSKLESQKIKPSSLDITLKHAIAFWAKESPRSGVKG